MHISFWQKLAGRSTITEHANLVAKNDKFQTCTTTVPSPSNQHSDRI